MLKVWQPLWGHQSTWLGETYVPLTEHENLHIEYEKDIYVLTSNFMKQMATGTIWCCHFHLTSIVCLIFSYEKWGASGKITKYTSSILNTTMFTQTTSSFKIKWEQEQNVHEQHCHCVKAWMVLKREKKKKKMYASTRWVLLTRLTCPFAPNESKLTLLMQFPRSLPLVVSLSY